MDDGAEAEEQGGMMVGATSRYLVKHLVTSLLPCKEEAKKCSSSTFQPATVGIATVGFFRVSNLSPLRVTHWHANPRQM